MKKAKIKFRTNKGITLIALVITIIIILILAGITIRTLTGDTGLIAQAKKAKFISEVEELKENIVLYKYSELIDDKTNQTTNENNVDYSSLVPQSLKQYIEVLDDGEIVYIGDNNAEEKNWLQELEIYDKQEYILKRNLGELVDLAKQYVEEVKNTANYNLLALQYIRRNRYTSQQWTTLGGEIDLEFVKYVDENKSTSLDIDNFIDPISGDEIDFVHSMASLNVYIYKLSSNDPIKQYACWAGDLCTFTEEIYQWYNSGSYTESELKEYTNSKLGGNSSFGLADMLADADAVNIAELAKLGGDIDDIIYNYYYGNNLDKSKLRYANFANYLKGRLNSSGTDQQRLYKVAYYYLGQHNEIFAWVEIYASRLIPSFSSIPDVVFETVATCFSEYICERI